jgi:hypothetical protein
MTSVPAENARKLFPACVEKGFVEVRTFAPESSNSCNRAGALSWFQGIAHAGAPRSKGILLLTGLVSCVAGTRLTVVNGRL